MDIQGLPEIRRREIGQGPRDDDARVVHDGVNPAKVLNGVSDRRRGTFFLRDVGTVGHCDATELNYLGRDAVGHVRRVRVPLVVGSVRHGLRGVPGSIGRHSDVVDDHRRSP